ncbi:MAG TPA: amidase [Burkholderiaceae bacterium]|nr:amidase [Burkholderiaceae bacterium]
MTMQSRADANDAWGAFCPDGVFHVPGAASGPLARARLGVKDMFDIAGHRTGAGNPDWLASHPPASRHAKAVDLLLAAGADIVGKTLTDELAYSLNGENHHYGTPVNPVSPERIPGGSSCGSAVAAAAGLCDIGLGGDTAGSIRLPATFCGAWGFRPTHGAVSSEGAVALAPSYDTVGWITRDADMLARVGDVLLPADRAAALPTRLLVADDAWALANPDVRGALDARLPSIMARCGSVAHGILAADGLLQWQQAFRVIQGREVWATHGAWITARAPQFGPGIRERFEWAATISAEAAAAAALERERIAGVLDRMLEGAILCIPTVSFVAPLKGSPSAEEDRTRALCLLAIASLARLPQVAMPVARVNGCAVGLSLIGPRGMDRALLARAAELAG